MNEQKNTPNSPPLPVVKENFRSELELLRKELELREEEKDRELRSALLSVVSYLERLHGWSPRVHCPRCGYRTGGGKVSPPAPVSIPGIQRRRSSHETSPD